MTSISGLDSQDTPHTVDTESYQTSSEQKINCLKVTGSSVIRLIFRHDSEFGSRKKIQGPKIWDLSFHLSYLRAKSVDGARNAVQNTSLAEVYPPIDILKRHLRSGSQLRLATHIWKTHIAVGPDGVGGDRRVTRSS